jgi:hypothetical protein
MSQVRPAFWYLLLATLALAAYVQYVELAEAPLGHTRCVGGEPVVWIRPGLTPVESALVAAHEEIHVHQARRVGCEAWEVMMGMGEGRLELEAEAYCADLLAIAPTEWTVEQGARSVVERFANSRRHRNVRQLGRERIAAELYEPCGLDEEGRAPAALRPRAAIGYTTSRNSAASKNTSCTYGSLISPPRPSTAWSNRIAPCHSTCVSGPPMSMALMK